jgi:hypothetical protein
VFEGDLASAEPGQQLLHLPLLVPQHERMEFYKRKRKVIHTIHTTQRR